jgi:hypothetical protein
MELKKPGKDDPIEKYVFQYYIYLIDLKGRKPSNIRIF